jgi:hypothetical protein
VVVVTTAAQPVAVAGVDPNRPLDRAADADEALDVLAPESVERPYAQLDF